MKNLTLNYYAYTAKMDSKVAALFSCPNCLPEDLSKDAKHLPYYDYITKEMHLCKHPLTEKQTCIHCTLPSDISYKIKLEYLLI